MKLSKSNGGSTTSVIVKINLACLVCIVTITLALQPSYLFKSSATKFLKAENRNLKGGAKTEKIVIEKAPEFLRELDEKTKIGLVNLQHSDAQSIGLKGNLTVIDLETVSDKLTWDELFPEWMDEEGEFGPIPKCPKIPMPDFEIYGEIDLVVAQLPCRRPEAGWERDVIRLQVHLVAAGLAVEKGKRDENGAIKLAFTTRCEPMRDIFRCDDLRKKDGTWWMYEVDAARLEAKVAAPIGACELILPLRDEGSNRGFDVAKLSAPVHHNKRREAYVTVLHSSNSYVCGAIALARSIRATNSTRDLILLHDEFINPTQLRILRSAGWSPRQIERIHNPNPRSDKLFEYNYSKFRIFQLTDYDKIVFIDSDILVLRNLDVLFNFPSVSTRGDHNDSFNSGIMVIEPSNCTFKTMMLNVKSIESENGGDQGFLNNIFVWWHRLPRRTNFFKVTWENTTQEKSMLDEMFRSDPPQLYAIHYFGLKPWMCYRDYDCNWDLETVRSFANDEAHWRWWQVYDAMDEEEKRMCRLSEKQKRKLELFRRRAERLQYADGHWKLNITDPRKDD